MSSIIPRQEFLIIETIQALVLEIEESRKKIHNWIATGVIPLENKPNSYRGLFSKMIRLIQLEYTLGRDNKILPYLYESIEYMYLGWDGFWKLKDVNGKESNQYILSGYDELIWFLSIAVLFNAELSIFEKVANIVDRDGVKDILIEFLLSEQLEDRPKIIMESYSKYFYIPETYEGARNSILAVDSIESESILLNYINKQWYQRHRSCGWYNGHKAKNITYFGYWSWETAAIVKIRSLSDIELKKSKYYPYDAIHQTNM